MTDMKAVFRIACADMESLFTEDLWHHVSNILYSPEFANVRYMLPSIGTAPVQSPVLLGYSDKDPIVFVHGERGTHSPPYVAIDGVAVSPKHAMQSLFAVRGVPASDFPHGILIRIIEDTQQRISAVHRFSIDAHLHRQEKEIDSFRFILGYDTYLRNLKMRYSSSEFIAFAPKTLLGHVWRRFQVQMW